MKNTTYILSAICIAALLLGQSASADPAYWKGDQSNIWNTNNGGASNWYADYGGTINLTSFVPDTNTDVIFATSDAPPGDLSTELGQDITINSLTIQGTTPTDTNSVSIAGTGGPYTLTIGVGGITVNSGAAAVTLSTNVALGASQTWLSTSINTVSGIVSETGGSQSLTTAGTGALTLSGASANTYTGLTTISAGALYLNKTGGVNAIGGNATVSGGSLIWLNYEQMGDSATLTLSSGAVNLNGNTETLGSFTNSGGTFTTGLGGHLIGTGASVTWSSGTNTINDGGSVEDGHVIITGGTKTLQGGAFGGVLKILSGGTGLEMTGSTLTLNNDNTVGGTLLLDGDVTTFASAATATIASVLPNTNPATVDLDGGTRTFTVADGAAATDMQISALIINGGLTKAGPGTLLLLQGQGVFLPNTYAGGTTVNDGTLQIEGAATLGSTSGSLTVNGGAVDVNGTNQSVGALSGSGGTIVNNANATTRALTVGNGDGRGSYAGVLADNNNATTGVLALIKTGSGTQTLTAANTYSGATTVSGGTLLVKNKTGSGTGSGAVQVNTGTLGGVGKINGAATVGTGTSSGATLLAGNSAKNPGTLIINNTLTFQSLATYKCLLNRTKVKASKVTASGVTINSNVPFTFVDTGTGTLTTGTIFKVINNTSANPIFGTFSNLPDGSIFTSNGNNFQVSYTGGNGNDLTLTVVP